MSDLIPLTEMDPTEKLTLTVHAAAQAGRTTKCRFGPVSFDAKGYAQLQVTAGDVHIVDSWGWLTKEDKLALFPETADHPVEVDEKAPKRNLAAQSAMAEAFNKERESLIAERDVATGRACDAERLVSELQDACDALKQQNASLAAKTVELEKQVEQLKAAAAPAQGKQKR
jgi:hypothetical protein